ncbi:MAG: hypothetical protein QOK35_1542 [Pseudonocardiales bacterium]|jgi:hypothetical protein|nr:hypothetical protein [Pseudonocardiales bacterium]
MSTPAPRRRRAAVLGLLTLLALLFTGAVAAPAASAGVCTTCPEPPPNEPGPHTPPAPVVKHRLTIKKIVAHDINDDVFNEVQDEIYLEINGQKVWGTYNISELDGIRYPGVAKDLTGAAGAYLGNVELFDHDTSSGDDRLAALNVYGNGSPTEITGSYDFHMSDSHYTVEIGLRQI